MNDMENIINWFLESSIRYLLYGLLILAGLWTSKQIMLSTLKLRYAEWKYRYRIRRIQSQTDISHAPSYRHPLTRHLFLLLRTVKDERNDYDVPVFLMLSGLFGFGVWMIVFLILDDIVISFVIGVLVSIIPYLYLRLRLNNIRHMMSTEFLNIVQLITQNYNAQHYDMYHALIETQKEIKNKTLRKVIVKLISDLQVARSEKELRESIQVFTYTAGTSWSKRLGSIILKAYLYDENVLNALVVLSKQMEQTEEMLEEEKSETLDHVYNGYLTLPIFIASLFLGYFTSGAQDWWKLQFGFSPTLFTFILSVVSVVFSLIIALFLKHPKNDL